MLSDENTIFIGRKSVMDYVLACVTQLNRGFNEIILKARGKSISRAVDVAEILRTRFMKDLKVKNIKIGTEQIQAAEGGTANVSAIEITLSK
ncbi:MAG: DNA-binding protein Alba [Candidatus Jordarchaeum sp.]|uniref:DNA-binding protein Alba n=1 Tax=Candidatus Jordarchaeum sp. TaxID=2823881 RepID=UPI00404AB20E